MFDQSVVPAVSCPAPDRKFFSLQEANRALPYVSRVVADIAETYVQILELRRELENLDEGSLRDLTEGEYESTMDRLGGLVDELHYTGAELRDFERGRIDFPSLYRGREIMLTWESGHPRVIYWHTLEHDEHLLRPVEELEGKVPAVTGVEPTPQAG